jgi:hypothetical protein
MVFSGYFSALVAPLALLYLIQLFRILDRWSFEEGERWPSSSLFGLSLTRDALLVTAAADIVFITSSISQSLARFGRAFYLDTTVGLALLVLHITAFVFFNYWRRRVAVKYREDGTSRRVSELLINIYLSVFVLMSNAFTLSFLLGPMLLGY